MSRLARGLLVLLTGLALAGQLMSGSLAAPGGADRTLADRVSVLSVLCHGASLGESAHPHPSHRPPLHRETGIASIAAALATVALPLPGGPALPRLLVAAATRFSARPPARAPPGRPWSGFHPRGPPAG